MLPFSHATYESLKASVDEQLMSPNSLGEHIRKRRLELRLLQREVATIIGVSEDCITYWENGRSDPQVHFYPAIIAYLGYYPFLTSQKLPGRIKRYRYEHGLTQKQMGKRVGVNGSTVCDWENGSTEPKKDYLIRLNRCLGRCEITE